MPLTNAEFDAILADTSKKIVGDLAWAEDEDHSPAVEFSAEMISDPGWPLFVRGRYNPLAGALSYVVVLKTTGRIYGLDLGKDHHNPTCQQVGEKHKHRWREQYKIKEAYVPNDITAPVTDPVAVWRQFCLEFNIDHQGVLASPPPFQKDLLT
jgi:hypothetical protein